MVQIWFVIFFCLLIHILEFRVNVTNKEDTHIFLKKLQDNLGVSFNVKSGRPDKTNSIKSILSGFRKCCLSVPLQGRKPKQPNKDSQCPANLKFW